MKPRRIGAAGSVFGSMNTVTYRPASSITPGTRVTQRRWGSAEGQQPERAVLLAGAAREGGDLQVPIVERAQPGWRKKGPLERRCVRESRLLKPVTLVFCGTLVAVLAVPPAPAVSEDLGKRISSLKEKAAAAEETYEAACRVEIELRERLLEVGAGGATDVLDSLREKIAEAAERSQAARSALEGMERELEKLERQKRERDRGEGASEDGSSASAAAVGDPPRATELVAESADGNASLGALLLVVATAALAWWLAGLGARVLEGRVLRAGLARVSGPAPPQVADAGLRPTHDGRFVCRAQGIRALSLVLARGTVGILASYLMLRFLGVGALAAGLGVLGIALVAARSARDLLRDVLRGVQLLLWPRFLPGDRVCLAGVTGRVESLDLRSTMLRDADGALHEVPNREVGIVTNISRTRGRVTVEVRTSYEEDVGQILDVLREVLAEVRVASERGGHALLEPARVGVARFEEDGAVLEVSVVTDVARREAVGARIQERVRERLDRVDVRLGESGDPEDGAEEPARERP